MVEQGVKSPINGEKYFYTRTRGATFRSSNTTLEQVRRYHRIYVGREFDLIQEARDQAASPGGKPIVTVEWGAGNTRALSEFARATRGMTRCIGYGRDSYRTWKRNRLVETIQQPYEQMPRFFKEKSIGILYSHHGLQHLLTQIGPEAFADYVGVLSTRLRPNGVLVSYPIRKTNDFKLERLLKEKITAALKGKGEFDIRVSGNTILIRRTQ
jgi:hypothetical protein